MPYRATGRHGEDSALFPPHHDFAFVDVETSGLDPSTNALLSIGVAVVRGGEVVSNWGSRVRMRSDREWTSGAERVHGITQQEAWAALPFEEIVDEMLAAMEGEQPAAHYAPFDAGFVERAFRDIGREAPWLEQHWLCTKKLSQLTWGGGVGHGLDAVAERCGLEPRKPGVRHDAVEDAVLAARCWINWPHEGLTG